MIEIKYVLTRLGGFCFFEKNLWKKVIRAERRASLFTGCDIYGWNMWLKLRVSRFKLLHHACRINSIERFFALISHTRIYIVIGHGCTKMLTGLGQRAHNRLRLARSNRVFAKSSKNCAPCAQRVQRKACSVTKLPVSSSDNNKKQSIYLKEIRIHIANCDFIENHGVFLQSKATPCDIQASAPLASAGLFTMHLAIHNSNS